MHKNILRVLFLLLSISVSSQENPSNEIEMYLSELHKKGEFNGNVLVVKNKTIIYNNSFGYSDESKKTNLTERYRFGLGSIYKEFPGVAIMQLREKKLLNLDDKLNTYLDHLPEWSKKISIKNLLQYSAGLPKVPWEKYMKDGGTITYDDVKKELLQLKKLDYEPGTNYTYTNFSPILLVEVVEKIAGRNFKEYAENEIFLPNGMKDIVIKKEYPFLDKSWMAMPFNSNFEKDNHKIKIPNVLFNATVKDLYTWLDRLHSFKIVNKESLKILSTKVFEGNEYQAPLGSCIWKENEVIEHTHHGSSGNYEGVFRRFQNMTGNVNIIVLTNQKNKNLYEITQKLNKIAQ
jgi:CubicO group peptidase (beta-lactamase class C family)